MISLTRYEQKNKNEWDSFIKTSKVDSFLFMRDYMDYHSDRFTDHSYIFYKKNKIVAVLPANIINNSLHSHSGLTYGGLVTSINISTTEVLNCFSLMLEDLKLKSIKIFYYKPTPFIYHTYPNQEDLYALFINDFVKIKCNISSTIEMNSKLKFTESRKSGIRKAKNVGLKISDEISNLEIFWELLTNEMKSKYQSKPVHSFEEIKMLNSKFPDNIFLFTVKKENEIIAGTVVYVMNKVVHIQYISSNALGKEFGGLDFIFDYLINEYFIDYNFFDFGTSCENGGYVLNEHLIFQKEGFGGRGVVYDEYKLELV